MIENTLRRLSLEDKIGQLLLVSIAEPFLSDECESFLKDTHAGNVIHFAKAAKNPAQSRALNGEIEAFCAARYGIRPIIAVDHEGGAVTRFESGVPVFPSALSVAESGKIENAYQMGLRMGYELNDMGFTVDLAPVMDVNINPDNPVIGVRAFGDEPKRTADYACAMLEGLRDGGVLPCAKHFPGHGDTQTDSHFSLPRVDKPRTALMAQELFPFRQAVARDIPLIMTTHILFPALDASDMPATMSRPILTGLLREEMGFRGVIVTDGMQMRAVADHYGVERGCVLAIQAGADLLCVGTGGEETYATQRACFRALVEAAKTGELPAERIDEAVARILALKAALPERRAYDGWADDERFAHRMAAEGVRWLRVTRPRAPLQDALCLSRPAGPEIGFAEGDAALPSPARRLARRVNARYQVLTDAFSAPECEHVILLVGAGKIGARERNVIEWATANRKHLTAVLCCHPGAAKDLPEDTDILCVYDASDAALDAAAEALR